jgi:hypothetical protein
MMIEIHARVECELIIAIGHYASILGDVSRYLQRGLPPGRSGIS